MATGRRSTKKFLLAALALPLLGYLGLCGLMYAQQRDLVYFPQATRLDAIHTEFELRRPGATLRGWVLQPGQKHALIYFGGNAEAIEGMRTRLARLFPDRSIYLVAYRGYGASDGSPEESLLQADALALFDHAKGRHREGDVAVIGRSLGSGVASFVAAQRPVSGLVLVTPFDSLAAVAADHYPWLPVDWLLQDRYDSDRHLAGYTGPVLVIRAGNDRVVPAERTDQLIAALPQPPEVVEVADASHDTVLIDAAPGEAMVRFLSR